MRDLNDLARADSASPRCAPGRDYVSEKLRQRRYDFSDQEVKAYFPEAAVLGGLFRLVETLYGIAIRPAQAAAYHPDVRFYEITAGGARVGRSYPDLYAREHKRAGAWTHGLVERRPRAGGVRRRSPSSPATSPRPWAGKPALFTHREVNTLFPEFGHGLHQLLTQSTRSRPRASTASSGTRSSCRAVHENFCWEWDWSRR